MILSNYAILKSYTSRKPLDSTYNIQEDIGLKDITGSTAECYGFASSSRFNCDNWSLKTSLSMRVGVGDTEPEFTDYALGSDITSSIANTVITTTTTADGPKVKTVITMSGRNSSSSAITITEVGITKNIVVAYLNYWAKKEVLMVKELLEEPIEVPGNGSFSLTFSWEEA